MPPLALIMSKYACRPSAYWAYLPPIGFVAVVTTATRISFFLSSTPGPRPATNLVRSVAGATVAAGPVFAGEVVGALCDLELPHAPATSATRTPTAARRPTFVRARIHSPGFRSSH